ncbi:MAG: hypothetical protein GY940_45655, partial [bacterium]|nr:hypothetical protein [bacterium]
KLAEQDVAKAYFGIIREVFPPPDGKPELSDDSLADLALCIDKVIEDNRKVNWVNDIDVQNRMRNEIEDVIFDFKEQSRLELDLRIIDEIMEQSIAVAKVRRP